MTFDVKALLKQVPTTAYIISGAVLILWGAWTANNYHQREIGKRELLIANLEVANRDLRHQADSLAKQYRVDTIRLRVTKTQVDTLTNTVENWKTDTLKVVEYVAKADTAIKACTQALLTCDQRVGVAQRGWDGARAENALLKASYPSKARPWLYGAVGVGVGYLAKTVIR